MGSFEPPSRVLERQLAAGVPTGPLLSPAAAMRRRDSRRMQPQSPMVDQGPPDGNRESQSVLRRWFSPQRIVNHPALDSLLSMGNEHGKLERRLKRYYDALYGGDHQGRAKLFGQAADVLQDIIRAWRSPSATGLPVIAHAIYDIFLDQNPHSDRAIATPGWFQTTEEYHRFTGDRVDYLMTMNAIPEAIARLRRSGELPWTVESLCTSIVAFPVETMAHTHTNFAGAMGVVYQGSEEDSYRNFRSLRMAQRFPQAHSIALSMNTPRAAKMRDTLTRNCTALLFILMSLIPEDRETLSPALMRILNQAERETKAAQVDFSCDFSHVVHAVYECLVLGRKNWQGDIISEWHFWGLTDSRPFVIEHLLFHINQQGQELARAAWGEEKINVASEWAIGFANESWNIWQNRGVNENNWLEARDRLGKLFDVMPWKTKQQYIIRTLWNDAEVAHVFDRSVFPRYTQKDAWADAGEDTFNTIFMADFEEQAHDLIMIRLFNVLCRAGEASSLLAHNILTHRHAKRHVSRFIFRLTSEGKHVPVLSRIAAILWTRTQVEPWLSRSSLFNCLPQDAETVLSSEQLRRLIHVLSVHVDANRMIAELVGFFRLRGQPEKRNQVPYRKSRECWNPKRPRHSSEPVCDCAALTIYNHFGEMPEWNPDTSGDSVMRLNVRLFAVYDQLQSPMLKENVLEYITCILEATDEKSRTWVVEMLQRARDHVDGRIMNFVRTGAGPRRLQEPSAVMLTHIKVACELILAEDGIGGWSPDQLAFGTELDDCRSPTSPQGPTHFTSPLGVNGEAGRTGFPSNGTHANGAFASRGDSEEQAQEELPTVPRPPRSSAPPISRRFSTIDSTGGAPVPTNPRSFDRAGDRRRKHESLPLPARGGPSRPLPPAVQTIREEQLETSRFHAGLNPHTNTNLSGNAITIAGSTTRQGSNFNRLTPSPGLDFPNPHDLPLAGSQDAVRIQDNDASKPRLEAPQLPAFFPGHDYDESRYPTMAVQSMATPAIPYRPPGAQPPNPPQVQTESQIRFPPPPARPIQLNLYDTGPGDVQTRVPNARPVYKSFDNSLHPVQEEGKLRKQPSGLPPGGLVRLETYPSGSAPTRRSSRPLPIPPIARGQSQSQTLGQRPDFAQERSDPPAKVQPNKLRRKNSRMNPNDTPVPPTVSHPQTQTVPYHNTPRPPPQHRLQTYPAPQLAMASQNANPFPYRHSIEGSYYQTHHPLINPGENSWAPTAQASRPPAPLPLPYPTTPLDIPNESRSHAQPFITSFPNSFSNQPSSSASSAQPQYSTPPSSQDHSQSHKQPLEQAAWTPPPDPPPPPHDPTSPRTMTAGQRHSFPLTSEHTHITLESDLPVPVLDPEDQWQSRLGPPHPLTNSGVMTSLTSPQSHVFPTPRHAPQNNPAMSSPDSPIQSFLDATSNSRSLHVELAPFPDHPYPDPQSPPAVTSPQPPLPPPKAPRHTDYGPAREFLRMKSQTQVGTGTENGRSGGSIGVSRMGEGSGSAIGQAVRPISITVEGEAAPVSPIADASHSAPAPLQSSPQGYGPRRPHPHALRMPTTNPEGDQHSSEPHIQPEQSQSPMRSDGRIRQGLRLVDPGIGTGPSGNRWNDEKGRLKEREEREERERERREETRRGKLVKRSSKLVEEPRGW